MSWSVTTNFDGGGACDLTIDTTLNTIDAVFNDPWVSTGLMVWRVDDALGETITLTADAGFRQPSSHRMWYSYDYGPYSWREFDDTVDGGWTHTFDSDQVYISSFPQYPYGHIVDRVTDLDSHPYVTDTGVYGQSVEGRDMHYIEISDPSVANSQKDAIIAITRQHPGETPGSYHMDAMINDVLIKLQREMFEDDYVFHFLPDTNPDGIYHASDRHHLSGVDMNREWLDSNPVPEVTTIKSYIDGVALDHNLFWSWDLHATTNPGFDAIHYDSRPVGSEELTWINQMDNHIISLTGTNSQSHTTGFFNNWMADSHNTPCVSTEAWYFHPYMFQEMRREGEAVFGETVDVFTDFDVTTLVRENGAWVDTNE